jgi:hypothetical protein
MGMAIQFIPLIMTPSLIKMSGTVMGKVNEMVRKPFAPIQEKVGSVAKDMREIAKLQQRKKALEAHGARGLMHLPGKLGAAIDEHDRLRQTKLKTAESAYNDLMTEKTAEYISKRKTVKLKDGTTTERFAHQLANDMKQAKELSFRAQAAEMNADLDLNEMSNWVGGYYDEATGTWKAHDKTNMSARDWRAVERSKAIAGAATRAWQRFDTAQDRQIINDREDAIWTAEQKQSALEQMSMVRTGRDADGREVTLSDTDKSEYTKEYERLVGSAINGLDAREKHEIQAVSRGIATIEADREKVVKEYSAYFGKIRTKELLNNVSKIIGEGKARSVITGRQELNIDALIAAQNQLLLRGDTTKIFDQLCDVFDENNKIELGSDDANRLARNLLMYKDADPTLGRFGKFINVQTWAASNNKRPKFTTMEEYVTSKRIAADGTETHVNGMSELLAGTMLDKVEREAFEVMDMAARRFNVNGDADFFIGDMTQYIPSLPKMASNSEQLLNAATQLTGMKKDMGSMKWKRATYDDANGDKVTVAPKMNVIAKFLSNLTANDLLNMKSDVMEAVLHAFAVDIAQQKGYDMSTDTAYFQAVARTMDDAKQLYRDFQKTGFRYAAANGDVYEGTGNLKRLQKMSHSGMMAVAKKKNLEILGDLDDNDWHP